MKESIYFLISKFYMVIGMRWVILGLVMLALVLVTPALADEDEYYEHGHYGYHEHHEPHNYHKEYHKAGYAYIKAEIYSNWTKVEVKVDGSEREFVLHTVNVDEIIDGIVNETGLDRSFVENNIRIEIKKYPESKGYFSVRGKMEEKKLKYRELMERKKAMKEIYLKKYNEKRYLYQKIKGKGLSDPAVFNASKDFVVYGIDFIISHLDSLELKIMSMNMNNSTASELLSEIDSVRSELIYWRDTISNSSTPDELRSNILAFSKSWSGLKFNISAITGKVIVYKLLDIIEQAESKKSNIEDKISDLESQGANTSKIRQIYSRYLARLNSSKQHAFNALEHFNNVFSAKNIGNANRELAKGKTEYYKAVEDLKKSINDLKNVFFEYRRALKNLGVGNSTSGG